MNEAINISVVFLNNKILFNFSIREFLPKEYAKTKGVEKRIFQVN